jgi:thiamine pyrophosphate-dependent acetolactate synthase large subunit-like protein
VTTVADVVGRTLVDAGIRQAFGVVGSGNFHVTNALRRAGVSFVAARHECGAATMADAYARMGGGVAAVTVHQGCGLTNAMTGITEAAKSRTPMVVVAAEVTNPRSNFYVDQDALARSVGATPLRVTSAERAEQIARQAVSVARDCRGTVVLNLPLHVQELAAGFRGGAAAADPVGPGGDDAGTDPVPGPAHAPASAEVERLAEALRSASRPVFVAGRGSRGPGCRAALEHLADACGALLATSAVANGLFHGNPWSLGISGGFASPLAAELITGADLIVGWGCSLNMWTMRHGTLIGPGTTVIQVDDTPTAIGSQRDGAIGVLGDVRAVAEATLVALGGTTGAAGGSGHREAGGHPPIGYRSRDLLHRITDRIRWRDVPFADTGTSERIDPRALSIALDDLLPTERVVGVDSGNFMGYPSAYLQVPDENGFCFTQAYQSIGLGLATTIGAALAQPGRLAVAALGDGGALMGAAELETVARLGLPMVVVVYNDAAYGAEVHHFSPGGHDLATVQFPDTDIAAIARGFGFDAHTVRSLTDLVPVFDWLDGDRSRPLLIDAKVTSAPSWWLEEAFRGH